MMGTVRLTAAASAAGSLQLASLGSSKSWPSGGRCSRSLPQVDLDLFSMTGTCSRRRRHRDELTIAYNKNGEGHTSDSFPPLATEDLMQYQVGSDNKKKFLGQDDVAMETERNICRETLKLPEKGYTGLFVRMLGMDNPEEEREEAVKALWRQSMGGKECIDEIVKFPGILPLLVALLPSSRPASSEAAAGLLHNISSFTKYSRALGEAGTVQEIIGILTRRSISQEVQEQAAGCLRNLSFEEQLRSKIDMAELLPVLVPMLDNEGPCKEAAVGILSNFALDEHNHDILVEAGIIPKLGNMVKSGEGSKVSRQEVRNTLLLLARNEHFKRLVIDEGLVPVPVIGANAYQSFKPLLDSTPPFTEEVKFDPSQSVPSAFGAGKLLLGLNIDKTGHDLDDATQLVIEGRTRQHFLGRIGLLGKEAQSAVVQNEQDVRKVGKLTIMPWWDGIPRLVLILGLEDASIAALAAHTISEIAVSEDICQAIQKAGGIPHLVRLLGSGHESATEASASALERLAASFKVRKAIYSHGAVPALVELLKVVDAPSIVKEKVLGALHRLSQTGEEVRAMIQSGAGLMDYVRLENANLDAKEEVEGIIEELSMRKLDSRDKIADANGIPILVAMLASERPLLKAKTAKVLENLAVKEKHAISITQSGLEKALNFMLDIHVKARHDVLSTQELIEREEIWTVVAAASRLLNEVMTFQAARQAMDCQSLAELLAKVLKSDPPIDVKDCVSACLLKLDRLVGLTTNVGIPIEIEVTVHNKIPRLIDEIGASFDPDVQERAVLELRDLVSQGIEDYVVAISDMGGIFPLVEHLDKGTALGRKAALSVLYSIGMNDENHAAILSAGAVPILQRIVRMECPQWTLALDLLRALPI